LELLRNLPANPIEFALSYYARYPVIHPTAYPPGFYLIEGAAFWVFGASPFVAKSLVLAFSLMAGLYVTAWLRRWIADGAGWGGALLVLQPGIILWSNGIMLNVPSMTLGLAALYHTRRWMEAPHSRHMYPAAVLALLAILTYVPSGIVVLIMLAWIVVERRWQLFYDRRALAVAFLSIPILLPWAYVAIKWAPMHFASVYHSTIPVWSASRWTYYLERLPEIFTPLLLVLATLGALVGLRDRRWRREVTLTLIWVLVCYAGLSYIVARESRYALLLGPPIVFLSVLSLVSFTDRWTASRGEYPSRYFLAGLAVLLVFHLSTASHVKVPRVEGFNQVAEFLDSVASNERLFYDGDYDGNISFYLLGRDHDLRYGVVVGHKLLYVHAISPPYRLSEFVSSPADVVGVFRSKCGCRWLAIEKWGKSGGIAAVNYLRQAVTGPEFELVKTFPIAAPRPTQVDIYRFLPSIETPEKLELRFPTLGEDAVFWATPLER
jgi:hypothetical protein